MIATILIVLYVLSAVVIMAKNDEGISKALYGYRGLTYIFAYYTYFVLSPIVLVIGIITGIITGIMKGE